jgi:PAS domain-containing protein
MLTGDSESIETAVAALREGAMEYLIKPVAMEKLLAAVRCCLRIHALETALASSREEAAAAAAEVELAVRDLAERLFEGWLELDGERRVRHCNRPAAELLGQEVLGRRLGDLLPTAPEPGGEGVVEVGTGASRRSLRLRSLRRRRPGGGEQVLLENRTAGDGGDRHRPRAKTRPGPR